MNNIGQYVRINNSTNFTKIDENNINNNNKLNKEFNINDNIIEIDNENNNNISKQNFETVSKLNMNPYDDLYTFYKPFKICNILFCKIGKNLCFGFDKNYEPFFVIGPHWYLFILLSIIIFILCYFLFSQFIKIYGSYLIFSILFFFVYFLYILNFLLNPGLIIKHIAIDKNNYQCSECKVFYNKADNVDHCNFCNVCVKGLDHHCVWIGKCVGKGNIYTFYGMLIAVVLFYSYMLGITFYYLIFKKK